MARFNFHLQFLLLIFSHPLSLCMDPPMPPPIERTYPLDFQPMRFANDKESEDRYIQPNPISCSSSDTFEGMPISDLQLMLKHENRTATLITNNLIDENYLPGTNYTYHVLVGDHGRGKTVLAKAIAHQICTKMPWAYEYISSSAFVGKYRNQTGVNLRKYLKRIAALEQPTILIIDQLNKILEYPDSSDDDTAFASSLICDFLDTQRFNKKLFFIGIMNRGSKLSRRLKSRIVARTTFIEEPTTPQLKRIIFTSKCLNQRTQFHPSIDNTWLENFIEESPRITGRNFRGLALELSERQPWLAEQTITKENLVAARDSYLSANKDIIYIDPYECYRDQQERIHQENIRQQILLASLSHKNSNHRSETTCLCSIQ